MSTGNKRGQARVANPVKDQGASKRRTKEITDHAISATNTGNSRHPGERGGRTASEGGPLLSKPVGPRRRSREVGPGISGSDLRPARQPLAPGSAGGGRKRRGTSKDGGRASARGGSRTRGRAAGR